MTEYLNDSPIKTPEDDQYGVTPFASAIAKSIINIKNPVGSTIAINGPWGIGKSSAVNLLRRELENAGDISLVVSDFKCWWYRGEEALALAFLQNLNSMLSDTLTGKAKKLIPDLGRNLLQAGPVIGSAVALTSIGPLAAVGGKAGAFAAKFFPKEETVEKKFLKLSKILEKQDKRFLFIIDDIDRLSPDEALAIFRLVKSVGRLPNLMYLLVFDRTLAEEAVAQRFPSEGPHFLEKIIQASFELPAPIQSDLNNGVLHSINEVCGPIPEEDVTRIMNMFYDCVGPYITTPRHVARYRNAIEITWSAIKDEISIADFIALETIRLYEPGLFNAVRSRKAEVCGPRGRNDLSDNDPKRYSRFLGEVSEKNHQRAITVLQRLFPRLERVHYSNEFRQGWDAERRVCIETHFDTYFRFSLADHALSKQTLETVIERADEIEFVKNTILAASNKIRKNGQTMVPVYLDALITHAGAIEKEKVSSLMEALFSIHDDIDLEIDTARGMFAHGDTSLRYHWLIRRLTNDRYTIEERTDLYRLVLPAAQLNWLVDFASSAHSQYEEREGRQIRTEENLVSEEFLPQLKALALDAIRESANDNSLLESSDLTYILYRWGAFMDGDFSEVTQWTNQHLLNDEALVVLARQFTGESWSMGMGFDGLGDRVANRNVRAQISDETEIVDTGTFWDNLVQLRDSNSLNEDDQLVVVTFLEAWQRRKDHPND